MQFFLKADFVFVHIYGMYVYYVYAGPIKWGPRPIQTMGTSIQQPISQII